MNAPTVTPRQAAVLGAIVLHRSRRGFPPSIREIGVMLGINVATTRSHLLALRDKGLVAWEDGKSRTIRVTGP